MYYDWNVFWNICLDEMQFKHNRDWLGNILNRIELGPCGPSKTSTLRLTMIRSRIFMLPQPFYWGNSTLKTMVQKLQRPYSNQRLHAIIINITPIVEAHLQYDPKWPLAPTTIIMQAFKKCYGPANRIWFCEIFIFKSI